MAGADDSLGDSIRKHYTDLNNPAAFTGLRGFLKNRSNRDGDKDQVAAALSALPTFTLHRAARKRYPRRKVFVPKIGNQFSVDLLYVHQWKAHNKGVKFIVTAIDDFSRYGYLVPVKNKRPQTVIDAMELIFKTAKLYPKFVMTDAGTEFTCKLTQKYFKDHGIHHFQTASTQHIPILERWHRTLRERLIRWMHHTKTKKYLSALEKIVHGYNNCVHLAHGFKPAELNKTNEMEAFERLYGGKEKKKTSGRRVPKFKVMDKVLLSKSKRPFEKGSTASWLDEVFQVIKVNSDHNPITYNLKDSENVDVFGCVYEHEMQKVSHS